jgi:hypothetical protein
MRTEIFRQQLFRPIAKGWRFAEEFMHPGRKSRIEIDQPLIGIDRPDGVGGVFQQYGQIGRLALGGIGWGGLAALQLGNAIPQPLQLFGDVAANGDTIVHGAKASREGAFYFIFPDQEPIHHSNARGESERGLKSVSMLIYAHPWRSVIFVGGRRPFQADAAQARRCGWQLKPVMRAG